MHSCNSIKLYFEKQRFEALKRWNGVTDEDIQNNREKANAYEYCDCLLDTPNGIVGGGYFDDGYKVNLPRMK